MANTATAQSPIPLGYRSTGGGIWTTPVLVSFDTTGADLTIYDPADDAFFALTGWILADNAANQIIIKSGTTTLITLDLVSGQLVDHPLGEGILLTGLAKGEALIMQVSAQPVTMLVYVQEFKQFQL